MSYTPQHSDAYYHIWVRLLHTHCLENRIAWISVKAGLEFGKEFTGYGGNIADAGHWQFHGP